ETTGDVGFAPTDLAVGPDGDLFISIGGRGTRGGVFRVRYEGPEKMPPLPEDRLRAVLAADEPLSSWSRARWVPAAKKLGAEAFEQAVLERVLPVPDRARALEILTDLFGGVPVRLAKMVIERDGLGGYEEDELRARAVWSLSRSSGLDEA